MKAMAGALAGSLTTGRSGARRTTPLEHSVLSAIAEDEELRSLFRDVESVTEKMVVAAGTRMKSRIDSAVRAISKAQKVSLCFLVDTTGSMSGHIRGVMEQISTIVDEVRKSGCKVAGQAFVGYKDWCDGPSHFEVLPFGGDIAAFKAFLSGTRATGGGDAPEDVLGGLVLSSAGFHHSSGFTGIRHDSTRIYRDAE